MIAAIRVAGAVGAIAMSVLIILMVSFPKEFERTAVGFVKTQIEVEIRQTYPDQASGDLSEGLRRYSDHLGGRQERLGQLIESDLPEVIAAVVSAYCGCTDEVKFKQRAQNVRDRMHQTIERLGDGRDRLKAVIEGKYDEIVGALRRDLFIFLGTNLAAFVLVFATSFVRHRRRNLVVWPAILLLISVAISSYLYVYDEDWFFSIIFQDYAGYGYGFGMILIFGLLADVSMNRARVSLQVASALPSFLVPPC